MRKLTMLAGAVLLLAALSGCSEEENYYGYGGQNQITVTGSGRASAEPDMAVISLKSTSGQWSLRCFRTPSM